ncbi:MAG TPA: ATP-binding cassette domain-containing protein, partial [Candidatus Limnocylindrales bacterium]|nr:ATP-binding cassette domain-containing protein [Candidatus Limnocylindrales bacterium]
AQTSNLEMKPLMLGVRQRGDIMSVVFCLQGVSFREILTIPSLDIPAGSFYWVTGPSGGGKTTFLKLLNNLVTCDQGQVLYYGRDVLHLEPAAYRRRVVMVPQAPYIFPDTVRENIKRAFYFNNKDTPQQEDMAKLLSHFGMPGILDQDTITMSGGEKQRLALIRALLLDPEVLLLDEPTAALDSENAWIVVKYLAQWIGTTGKTVVMVSHDGTLDGGYADYILTLQKGKVAKLECRRIADE